MKILAIIGSPKGKGNSYKVTKEVEEKMNGMEDVTFEYLFLKDVDPSKISNQSLESQCKTLK
ncbi:MAG: NAD(P)H-dependent oxidoreductase, partial [Methanobacterium paludis]|nr:NAD(P)H-dependent oxidoreductase [Methanobacterium paludis]